MRGCSANICFAMAVLQLSRLIENPACDTLTIIGSKMQPFSISDGTSKRQDKLTEIKPYKTKQIRNIFGNYSITIAIKIRTDTTINGKLLTSLVRKITKATRKEE